MGHNTKDTLKERIELINSGAESEIKAIKRNYNSSIHEEVESTLKDIENNYMMGMLTIHESLAQKIELLTLRSLDLYSWYEVKP